MATINSQEIQVKVQSVIDLVKKKNKNEKQIARELHQLLEVAPGKTRKAKKKFIIKQLTGNKVSMSYLRRMLHAADFEMINELEPGTLKENQARLILEYTKDESLRLDLLKRALTIADTNKLTQTHVKEAISELKASLLKHQKNAQSISESEESENPVTPQSPSVSGKKRKSKKSDAGASLDADKTDSEDPNDPYYIDEERAIEIKTKELYKKLDPDFDSNQDRKTALDIIKGSLNVWAMCKIFAEYEKDQIDKEMLFDYIDPEKELRKVPKKTKSPNRRRKATKRR